MTYCCTEYNFFVIGHVHVIFLVNPKLFIRLCQISNSYNICIPSLSPSFLPSSYSLHIHQVDGEDDTEFVRNPMMQVCYLPSQRAV